MMGMIGMMDYDIVPRLFPSGWTFRPLKRRLPPE